MLGRRKRNRYKFTEKKQSKRGIAALVVAILIEIVYIVFLNAAFRGDGNLSMYYGSAGILMLGISLADFGFAIRSLFDEVVIDDAIKAAIDEYYKQYGCK